MPKKRRLIKEFSAGGVVFRRFGAQKKILLLKKKDKEDKWILPKGKIDVGETVPEAALREVQEETGLFDLKIISRLGQEHYFYRSYTPGKDLIAKWVYYFLMESRKGNPSPQREEGFVKTRWFTFKEALFKIAYKESKKIIQKAIDILSNQNEKLGKVRKRNRSKIQ